MSRKAHIKLPGFKWEGYVSSGLSFFLVLGTVVTTWLVIAGLVGWVTFVVLNWALGVFGYHVTGYQFIAGVVLLAIAKSAISYLLNRE